MEKYYAILLEIKNFIFTKYQERENLKQELKGVKKEQSNINEDRNILNAELSRVMEYQEEYDEKTIYEIITLGFPILLITVIIFCASLKVVYIKLIITSILLNIVGISLCLTKIKNITKKFERKRECKRAEINKIKKETEDITKRELKLRELELEIHSKLNEIEREITEKEEIKRTLQDNVIYALGPQLDALIEKEILANNNEGLANVFKRTRELMDN